MIPNIKILKIMKKMPQDIILLNIHVYHKWRLYDICFLKYKVWQKISTFWVIFLSFQPLDKLENQSFNIEKTPGDIIILHIWTINDNHMMYGSWDMERDRHDFCHFGPFFALLHPPPHPPPTTPHHPTNNSKNQNLTQGYIDWTGKL